MSNFQTVEIKDVLAAIYLGGTENGLGRSINDYDEIQHRKEAFIKNNPLFTEALQAIHDIVSKQVINQPSDTVKKGDTAFTALEKRRTEEHTQLNKAIYGEEGK